MSRSSEAEKDELLEFYGFKPLAPTCARCKDFAWKEDKYTGRKHRWCDIVKVAVNRVSVCAMFAARNS